MFARKLSTLSVRYYSRTLPMMASHASNFQNAPKEHSCGGISPWNPPLEMPPPPKIKELPTHLVRLPCMPGSKPGGYPICDEWKGLYCPVCRLKYKFPPFSENIDFVLPKDQDCWWKGSGEEECQELDTSKLSNISSGWDCNYD